MSEGSDRHTGTQTYTWPSVLHSSRLQLRCWEEHDLQALHESWSRSVEHLRPWIPPLRDGMPSKERLQHMLTTWIHQHETGFAAHYRLAHPPSTSLLGEVMLIDRQGPGILEVGYQLDAGATGNGYATEAVRAMMDLARSTHGVHRLRFCCDHLNTPSIQVAERVGAKLRPELNTTEDGCHIGTWELLLE